MDIVPGTVSTDLFDSSQGTIVTGHDTIIDPINTFRTNSGFEEGHTLMRNGGIDSVSFIEFETTDDVMIKGVRLFAHNDGAATAYRRAMKRFRLLADRDADGTYELVVVDSAINVNYANQSGNQATNPTNLDLTLITPHRVVRSQFWRLEVTQGTSVGQFEGARLVELDAIAADSNNCDIVPGISTDDPFDFTQGTVITGHDTIVDPVNTFSTCEGFENGHTLMRNGGGGSLSFINFTTLQTETIEGIRLFAHHDGAGNGFRRAMNHFKLLADTDNNDSYETVVVDTAVNTNYAQQSGNNALDPTNLDLTLMAGSAISSQNWRIEVTQGTNVQPYEGARIVEVDAISSSPVSNKSDSNNAEDNGGGSLGYWSVILLLISFMTLIRRYHARYSF